MPAHSTPQPLAAEGGGPGEELTEASMAAEGALAQFMCAIEATHEELRATALNDDSPLNRLIALVLAARPAGAAEANPTLRDLDAFDREASRFEALLVALSNLLHEVDAEAGAVPGEIRAGDAAVRRAMEEYLALRADCQRTVLLMRDAFRPRLTLAHRRCDELRRMMKQRTAAGGGGATAAPPAPTSRAEGGSLRAAAATVPRGSVPPPARRGKGHVLGDAHSQRARTGAEAQPTTTTTSYQRGDSEVDEEGRQLQQQLQQQHHHELRLSNGQVLRGVSVTDEHLAEEAVREMERLAEETAQVRALMTTIDTQVERQQERLAAAEHNADNTLHNATSGRQQLAAASRLRLLGATLTGAVFGGLVGGPAGLVVGAKSASTLAGCVAGGMFVGGAVTRGVTKKTATRNAEVDLQYEAELEEATKAKRP